ncbi:FitA-like ribbon-helix-helix domain-containing protein [Microbacterium sp. A84]|uniref:FitA-like ribbon-helix-helix domain-containing protein n=1 Tax=Microbacterium sp. A84 TaxID=3450715 RepID=UPI003F436EB2
MPNVLIRDLPPEVHAVLTARAEANGQSLQQYLTQELTRIARTKTNAELTAAITARGDRIHLTAEEILDAIHRGRAE